MADEARASHLPSGNTSHRSSYQTESSSQPFCTSGPGSPKDDTEAKHNRMSKFTETTEIKKQNLNVSDIAALVLNKMIGTGIFTTPGMVLALTDGKGVSVFLW